MLLKTSEAKQCNGACQTFLSTVVINISPTKEALPQHITHAKRVEQHRLAQKHLHSTCMARPYEVATKHRK